MEGRARNIYYLDTYRKRLLTPDSDDTWLIVLTYSALEIIQNFSECHVPTLDQRLERNKKIEIFLKRKYQKTNML